MRFLLSLLVCATACSTQPASVPDAGPQGPSLGTVFAQLTEGQFSQNGGPLQQLALFGAALYPADQPQSFALDPWTDTCRGATATVGACCFVPGSPFPTPPSCAADGGPCLAFTMLDAGTLTLDDTTTNTNLGSVTYSPVAYGTAGFGLGYPDVSTTWSAGDVLTATATGGAQVGAFTASGPALALPTATVPSSIAHDQALTLTWTRDAAATAMFVALAGGSSTEMRGMIRCTTTDAAQTLTIDASLLSQFQPGDQAGVELQRSTSTVVAATNGTVTFTTAAQQTAGATIE